MKKTFRIISFVLVVVLVAGVMTACVKKEDETLSVSNWPNAEANPDGYKLYQNKKSEFEKMNPGSIIEPDEWSYDVQTFLAKAEGEDLPDLYYTHFTELEKIIDGGYAKDIKDELVEHDYYDKINSEMLKRIEKDGKVYFIPKSCYTIGMALNLELFEEAGLVEEDGTPVVPKTLDELVELAKNITEKTGKPGFIFPTTNNQGGWYFTMLAWNYGVEFVEKVDGRWKASFDNDDCVKALEYLKDLKWKYNVLPANTLVDQNEINKQIGSSLVAMAFMAPDQVNSAIINYGADKNIIGFTYVPAGPKNHVTLLGGSVVAFSNTASDKDVIDGFKWLEYENMTPVLSEDYKKKYDEKIGLNLSEGKLVGLIDTSIWNENSETYNYTSNIVKEKCNVNYNHIKYFNENKIATHSEVEVCAQELYSILDSCIQEVLTNESADCKVLIKNAAADFQSNFLDYEN